MGEKTPVVAAAVATPLLWALGPAVLAGKKMPTQSRLKKTVAQTRVLLAAARGRRERVVG
jgi:hypothetical protein